MKNLTLQSYSSPLDLLETQRAIKYLKDDFERRLAKKLDLVRVSAPLFVTKSSGLNDGLNGLEEPISFVVGEDETEVEIVHSLAKWKRYALGKYQIPLHKGLYTDMNAIRKDEHTDFLHSVYVDQWDWEIAISDSDRTLGFLKKTVRRIYSCIYAASLDLAKKFPVLKPFLPKDIFFISTRALERMYPHLTRKEREDEITRIHGAVFLYRIGENLCDKAPHDGRAADYDDWKLNGDILVYYPLRDMAMELSSMGIRVNAERLQKQLAARGETHKLENAYCKAVMDGSLPFSIGGGIGQSRLCMCLLQKAHIGEVQASIWDEKEIASLKKQGIELL